MKTEFKKPEIEIINVGNDEIITTSTRGGKYNTDEEDFN